MPDAKEYNNWFTEAWESHQDWKSHSEEEWAFYNGDQWDSDTLSDLKRQKRAHLTLNYLRSLVRLIVGYEQRTRYDLKVFPVGDVGDDDISRLLSGQLKFIRKSNNAEFVFSNAFK